jgi:predicted HicB family RNase H-like nuclease
MSMTYKGYVSFCRRHGREAEKPLSGRLTLRMGPALHRELLSVAAREGRSLNAVVRASIEEYVGSHS